MLFVFVHMMLLVVSLYIGDSDVISS